MKAVAVVTVPLREVVERVMTWDPVKSGNGGTFTYIDLSAVDQGAKRVLGARPVACLEAPSRARQVVAKDDVLVATVRPNLNTVALVPEELDHAVASTGFCVLRPSPGKLESRYLYHWVRAPHFVAAMVKQATGASYPAISDNIVKASVVPLPSLAEQRRIADILDKADSLRALRLMELQALGLLARSLFADCLRTLHGESREFTLAELAANQRGSFVNGPFGSDLLTSELRDDGVPVIYIRDIRDGQYERVSTACISAEKAQQLAVCSVQPDDVLVAKVGDPPGASALYPTDAPAAVVTQDVVRIRPNRALIDPTFLWCYLNSSTGQRKIVGITIKATRARFALGQLKTVTIDVPPIDHQRALTAKLAVIQRSKRRVQQSITDLDALFASLQHHAFRGDL